MWKLRPKSGNTTNFYLLYYTLSVTYIYIYSIIHIIIIWLYGQARAHRDWDCVALTGSWNITPQTVSNQYNRYYRYVLQYVRRIKYTNRFLGSSWNTYNTYIYNNVFTRDGLCGTRRGFAQESLTPVVYKNNMVSRAHRILCRYT